MVVMGRIAAALGVRGLVKVQPFTEKPDGLMKYRSWWIGKEEGPWREVEVRQCELHNRALAVQFADCPDRDAAERLKSLFVAVPRSSLPEQVDDEYYWTDLIGLSVVNEAGVPLGTVVNLLETGANQVLRVKSEDREILIPFVATAIRQVDLKSKTIRVDWSADY